MAYRELIDFVHVARTKGARDPDITLALKKAGWYAVDIQDALDLHTKLNQPEATLASMPVARQRGYDARLVVVAVAAFLIGFVGYLLLSS